MAKGKQAVRTPYEGGHAESLHSIWHDPTTYDHLKMGPPYLPSQAEVLEDEDGLQKQASTASREEVHALVAKEVTAIDAELAGLLAHFLNDYKSLPMAELAALLAYKRALAVMHQSHHWQTQGPSFYADHLLFDRLYNDSLPMIDQLAERAVGTGAPVLVNPIIQATHIAALLKSLYNGASLGPEPEQYILLSLKAELRFLVLLRMVYELLEQKGQLSHGTDNLLQGIADKHEEFVYLLKQRSDTKTASYGRSTASRQT